MLNRKFLEMYSRVRKYNKRRFWLKTTILTLVTGLVSFMSTTAVNTASMLTITKVREAENNLIVQPIAVDLSAIEAVSEIGVQEEYFPESIEKASEGTQPVYQEVVITTHYTNRSYPTVLANGNTAGVVGSEAAAQMAAATGVSQATWEYIIARESNGNPNAANASGASGLFQTMPGWGSTATVQDQINSAINAYNNQGLAAWGM